MNKSLFTNILALTIAVFAYFQHYELLFITSIFALSGAITNWLAVYMLFEKVPGLYGSGVIPTHFEAFKRGISDLVMQQFFSTDNINRFLTQSQSSKPSLDFTRILDQLDLSPAFDSLVKTIMASPFSKMLTIVGGEEALKPLRTPFLKNMRAAMLDITTSTAFTTLMAQELAPSHSITQLKDAIEVIVSNRLNELSPQMVKDIIQRMIRQHLSWLVVWGGVFGALIGLLSARFGMI